MFARLTFFPRSLVGRVFALYTVTLLVFVGGGLGLFYQFQFSGEIEDAQNRAENLASVIVPTISDSAVIGDDDTIAKTLERAISHSSFASVAFIDLKGRQVRAVRTDPPTLQAPEWLVDEIRNRLFDTNRPINAGGRDYGVLRLTLAPELIAGELWRPARAAMLLGVLSIVLGLFLIRWPLVQWLGQLGKLRTLEENLLSGEGGAPKPLDDNAPIELRQTFAALNQAAENLQAQREQAAVTLGSIDDAVLTLDAHGKVMLANPAASVLFDTPFEGLLEQDIVRLLPEAFEGQGGFNAWRGKRIDLVTSDGQKHVFDTTLSPILGTTGEVICYVLACRDITEQHILDMRLRSELATRQTALIALRGVLEGLTSRDKLSRNSLLHKRLVPGLQMEAPESERSDDDIEAISLMISGLVSSLQERSEQLNAIFALSPDGFVSFDARQCVSYVNPAFMQLTGLSEADVLGHDEGTFSELLSSRCSSETRAHLPSFATMRREARDEDDGTTRRAVIEVERPIHRVLEVGLRVSQSDVISQVFHLRDVTHETEVDRMKSEFLSTAAHELRTPMSSIFGFCELLLVRQHTPERQKDMLNTIHRQTKRMIAILNELLDLARIEARRGADFVLEAADLTGLLRDAVSDFRPPGDRTAPDVSIGVAAAWVRIDRNKMHQALSNVLSNAYKYSPDGGPVELKLLQRGQMGTDAMWGIEIQDHGMGMTPEQVARISERFYRADASGNIPGTGLGMSIVKEIVTLLGGSMDVRSEFGQGTCVTLWLPVAPAPLASSVALLEAVAVPATPA